MKKETTKKKPTDYSITVNVLGKNYTATGASVIDALKNLNVGIGRGRSIVTVTHGDAKREKILTHTLTSRLFNTRGLSQEVTLKNVSLMFDV